MKLYTVLITATLDDLETLAAKLSAEVVVEDASLIHVAQSVIPAHLRKVAADVEAQQA